MDNNSDINSLQLPSNMPSKRNLSRFEFYAALLCSCVAGIGVLALIQSRSQAQPEYATVQSSMEQPASRSRLPSYVPNTFLADPKDQPSSFPTLDQRPETQWVREERMQYYTDPTSGATVARPVVTIRPAQNPGAEHQNYSVLAAEAEVNQLADQYHQASPSFRDSILQALNKKLSDLFDARQQEQVSRAEKIRAELKETQDLLDRRVQLKAKIIERRVKELTGQQDELSWNPQASRTLPGPDLPLNGPSTLPPAVTPQANAAGGFSPSSESVNRYESSGFDSSQKTGSMLLPIDSELTPPTRQPAPVANDLPSQNLPVRDVMPVPQIPSSNAVFAPTSTSFAPTAPMAAPSDQASNAESQRSYMSVGFKLKKLLLEFEGKKETLGKEHPAIKASGLESAIEDTQTAWDFERQTLKTELESAESELHLAQRQSDLAEKKNETQKESHARGSANIEESWTAERAALAAQREVLQLQFRLKSVKNAIEWMDKFEEKFIKPFDAKK